MSRVICGWGLTLLVAASTGLALAQTPGGSAKNDPKPPTAKSSAPAPAATPQTTASGYALGPGDVLAISVWQEPGVSGTVPVRPDGKISLPLIGEVQASGLAPEQLQKLLTFKLKAYIEHPQVTVVVQEVRSRTFNVLGAVVHPGVFPLDKPMTVLDAIAQAGGFAEFAKKNKVYVLRRKADGSRWLYPFDYPNVIKGHKPWQNIDLLPNDTVVIPS
ncbi:MAG: polysaccharide biosynthesis/export family protein [Terriglobales bacterium]